MAIMGEERSSSGPKAQSIYSILVQQEYYYCCTSYCLYHTKQYLVARGKQRGSTGVGHTTQTPRTAACVKSLPNPKGRLLAHAVIPELHTAV